MTAYSQNSLKDSINYPVKGIDPNGVEVVTITKEQQKQINTSLLYLRQCQNREQIKSDYISVLELQLEDYKKTVEVQDSSYNKVTLMLENRQKNIYELQHQLALKEELVRQTKEQEKASRRKLLGWKIGTFATIGVTLVAIPVTIYILTK